MCSRNRPLSFRTWIGYLKLLNTVRINLAMTTVLLNALKKDLHITMDKCLRTLGN